MTQRLYIVMREDIPSMNPGKGMAQAAHAQAEFDAYLDCEFSENDELAHNYTCWREDMLFGTTIVLRAEQHKLIELVETIEHCGLVVDRTYPWQNWYGKRFVSSETTCVWAFVYNEAELEYMQQFSLQE